MTAADMKDMLGDLAIEAHAPRVKKQKVIEKRPEGVPRELFALFGERAPPIAILDTKAKERPKFSTRQKVRAWERKQFTNPARDDGLILRHWQRKEDTGIAALATPADSNIASEMDTDEKEKDGKAEAGYPFAKFNVKVTVPEYSDEQYESHLKSEDWSKEETDYLVNIAQEYDLRWIVISDRYEYQPSDLPKESADSMSVAIPSKDRSMEDMKARYYSVAAKTMALKQPLQSMSTTEFELHEKMTKFDATLETTRKKLAQTLFVRPLEEVREEELLLAELKRIVTNQEKFSQERKELYDRLQAPHSAVGSTAMYKTSQDLLKLMQDLLSADKNKKRRSMGAPGEGGPGLANGPSIGASSDRGPRSSLGGSGAGNTDKRASLSGSTSTGPKQLSAREEAKYGIAHLERSSTGTTFRHERINNLAKAKSNALTLKMTHALQELGIPMRLSMPTAAVCNEYEKLIGAIHTLLDVRKVSEKLEAEIKVARAQVEEKAEGTANGEQGKLEPVAVGEDGDEDAEGEDDDEADAVPERVEKKEEEENDDDEDEDGDGEEEEEQEEEEEENEEEVQAQGKEQAVADSADEDADADGDGDEAPEEKTPSEAATTRRNSVRKRSASVVSHFSNKSTKRQRK
ncbi:MAG: hypothetical protein Q9195_001884 [Heterodermia aff. obscurata]